MHDEKQVCKIATPEILINFQRLKGHTQMLEINIFGAEKILVLEVDTFCWISGFMETVFKT